MIRTQVLVTSDRAAMGEYEDETGPALRAALVEAGHAVAEVEVIADDRALIAATLITWTRAGTVDVIFTAGGTGISPRDVTPEATRDVIDIEIPGLGELMRAVSGQTVPTAALSRALAGRRRQTLIVNLPGSVKGAVECAAILNPLLAHAVSQLQGGHH